MSYILLDVEKVNDSGYRVRPFDLKISWRRIRLGLAWRLRRHSLSLSQRLEEPINSRDDTYGVESCSCSLKL